MIEETCEECKFWTATIGNVGECHVGPPNPGLERWCVLKKGDWCGCFKKREKVEAPLPDRVAPSKPETKVIYQYPTKIKGRKKK